MRVKKRFCCFFPNYDNKFLTIDIDLRINYNQVIHWQHEI